jgi:ankyrin repeat protein
MAAGGDLRPPIIDATRNGDREALRALLAEKSNVNAAEADGSTALLWAAYRDDLESVEVLLGAGADANAANDLGATALWAASQNGNAAAVRMLLKTGANANASLLLGETPLMVAARSGHVAVVEQLLANGANVDAKAGRDQTALMWAVTQQHPEVVEILLTNGADVHAQSAKWSEVMAVPPHGYLPYNRDIPHGNDTALLLAARVGSLASARLLIAAGANVDDADAWGITATTLAAHSGFTDLVEFLLEKGADPNKADAGFSALHIAVMRRDERMAGALLARGADANARLATWTPTRRSSRDFHFPPPLVGATPFWLAARFNEPNIMRLLVKHGADPLFVQHSRYMAGERFNERTEETTALLAAAGMGGGAAWVQPPAAEREPLMLETVKLAVELGVDVNAANTDGRTALQAAKALQYESVVEYLTQKGAK